MPGACHPFPLSPSTPFLSYPPFPPHRPLISSFLSLARRKTDMERTHVLTQTYEGGYGQTPQGEALGGPTYCALAALYLVPANHACAAQARLQGAEWHATVRWLLHTQAQTCGGLSGRTNKMADACYGFWCGAALAVRRLSLAVYVSSLVAPTGQPICASPLLCRLDPWCRQLARCARARRVSRTMPV
jgi:hypothetical protein